MNFMFDAFNLTGIILDVKTAILACISIMLLILGFRFIAQVLGTRSADENDPDADEDDDDDD